MKKHKLTLLCVLLTLTIIFASVLLVGCNDKNDGESSGSGEVTSGNISDPSKLNAIITADAVQEFIYDGNIHNVQATLNHDEATLSYSPCQGYVDPGSYYIYVTAPATEHYNSAVLAVNLIIWEETVNTRWDSFISDVKGMYSIDSPDVKFNVKADATIAPKNGEKTTLKFNAVGNLDLRSNLKNNSNAHALFEINDEKIGIYCQQNSTYLKLNDDLFHLDNVDITSLFSKESSSAQPLADNSIASIIIEILPSVLFSDKEDIVKTDGVWALSLNLSEIWTKVEPLLSMFAKDVVNEDNMTALNDFFKTNETTFEFTIDCNTKNAIKAEAGVNVSTYGSFKANVSALEISNGSYDSVDGALTQAQMTQAKTVKAANATAEGKLMLVNKLGETYEHLNWKLVADIDPVALAEAINTASAGENTMNWLNDEKVRNMKLYFSLYHEHQAGDNVDCIDAMCPTRAGGMEDTTILDVAFDPQNFGDSKLYLAANLSRVFSAKSLTATLQNLNGLINSLAGSKLTGLLDESFFTAIDLTKTVVSSESDPEEPEEPGEDTSLDIKTIVNPILEFLRSGIKFQDSAITLDMEQTYALLDTIFDLNSIIDINLENMIKINATNVKNAVFKGLLSPDDEGETDKAFNSLSLSISSIEYGNAETFNCKDAITHDPIDSSKAREFGGSKPLAFNNANATATGKIFNTKQTFSDYTVEAGGIHATIEELDNDVVGKLAEYTYTAMDNQTYTAITQIIAYDGLDKTKLNVPQTIKAIVLPLDGQGGLFSDLLWSVLQSLGSSGLIAGFLPSNITIPFRADVIDMQIVLTEVESATFTMNEEFESAYELTPYELDPTAKVDMSKHFGGTIDIVYADNFTRTISANCENDLVDGKYLVNDGKTYTITLTHYSMPDVKQDFTVKAQTPEKPSLIINSDGGISVLNYGPTQDMQLNVVLKTNSYTSGKVISSSDYIITIGGKTLDEINLNSEGAKRFDLASNSGDVKVNFKQSVAKTSTATAYFSLTYGDGSNSAETKYPTYFVKVAQEALWGTISSNSDLGANLNGKLTYTYWTDEDDEFADARALSLLFEDGKYYMVDNAENPTVKIETTLTAYDKNDTTKTNILVNGLIPFEKLQELSYDSAKKASKTPSINISATFTVDGQSITKEKTSQGLTAAYNLTYTSYVSKIESEKTFDDMIKFVILKSNGESHDMRLAYKNGKYVFVDTFEGAKLDDIEVDVVANVAISSTAIGDEITLTDGKLSADLVDSKVTLTVNFTYDEREYSSAVLSNKTVA